MIRLELRIARIATRVSVDLQERHKKTAKSNQTKTEYGQVAHAIVIASRTLERLN